MLDAQALELAGLSKKAIDGRIVSSCNLKLRYVSSSQPSTLKKFHVVQDEAESIACSLGRDGSSMAAWLQHWCQFGHGHSTLSPVFKYLESSSPAGRPSALEKFHVVWVVRGLGLYGYVIFHKFPLRRFQRRAQLRWQQVRPPESPLQVVGLVQVFSSNELYALKVILRGAG